MKITAIKGARVNTLATLLLAMTTSLLCAQLDRQGFLSRAIGWSSVPFNIVLGLDVTVWAMLLFLARAQEWKEFFGAVAIGGLILTVPHTLVSFVEINSFLPYADYKAKVVEATHWTIVAAAILALFNDSLVRREEHLVHHASDEISQ
jgi:hypothetical protein